MTSTNTTARCEVRNDELLQCALPADHGPDHEPDQAEAALAATSTPALLRAAYALTHRIHEWEDRYHSKATNERTQRDLIDAEVLRRTGGA